MLKIATFLEIGASLSDKDQYAEFAKTSGHYLHLLVPFRLDQTSHSEAVAECMFGYLEAVPDASQTYLW